MTKQVDGLELLSRVQQLGASAFGGRATRIDVRWGEGENSYRVVIEAQAPASAGASGDAGDPAALTWNVRGHGVVALIAKAHLGSMRPDVMLKLDELLANDPSGRVDWAIAARWPDDMKDDAEFKAKTGPWHYVNLPYHDGDSASAPDTPAVPAAPTVLSALPEQQKLFVDETGAAQVDALCWILHLVGDLHQPLHCIGRISPEHPNGDRGGNGYKFSNSKQNLHTLFDGLLVGSSARDLEKIANSIIVEHPATSFTDAQLEVQEPEAWAREGWSLAIEYGYLAFEEGSAPTAQDPAYVAAKSLARLRAALGGYRLATFLSALVDQL